MKKRKTIIVCAAIAVVLLAALGYAVLREPFVRTETVLAEGLSTQTTLYTPGFRKTGKNDFLPRRHHMAMKRQDTRRRGRMVDALKPKEGKILLIPEANRPAIQAYMRTTPDGVNMNRVYPGDTEGNDVEKLCAQITALIACEQPVAVIDMHEGFNFYGVEGSIGNSIVAGAGRRELPAASGYSGLRQQPKRGLRAFTYDTNAPKGSLNREMHHLLGVDTYTIETSQKLPLETRIRQQLTFVEGLLTLYGIPYQMDLPQ